jgi:surfactin synthase thioesterase subunit
VEVPLNTPRSTPGDTLWVRVARPASLPEELPVSRLLLCPSAGSGAGSSSAFAAALPLTVEVLAVQYPGRGDRRKESGIPDVCRLADHVVGELKAWCDLPLTILGHSFGAAVAFEVTRRLERDGCAPRGLVVSGRPAPSAGLGLPVPRNDEDIVAELERTGTVSPRLLARPSMRRSIVSVLRADFHANATYRVPDGTMVSVPMTFLLSKHDPYVDADGAHAWSGHTTGGFQIARVPGGHTFLDDHAEAAAAAVARNL